VPTSTLPPVTDKHGALIAVLMPPLLDLVAGSSTRAGPGAKAGQVVDVLKKYLRDHPHDERRQRSFLLQLVRRYPPAGSTAH
jgi:hypothetical protein